MDNDKIPPLKPPEQMPPIHSQHDLQQHWRALMGPLGFSERLLWLGFIDTDRRMTPMLSQISDIPAYPDSKLLAGLLDIATRILRDPLGGGSVAIMVSRPGRAAMTDSDLAWARALTEAARVAELPFEPVHLANDEILTVFSPDDLAPAKSA